MNPILIKRIRTLEVEVDMDEPEPDRFDLFNTKNMVFTNKLRCENSISHPMTYSCVEMYSFMEVA